MVSLSYFNSLILLFSFCTFGLNNALAADSLIDGDWQLSINGTDHLEFGTQFLAAGVKLEWQVNLLFSIKGGIYTTGTGNAFLKPKVTSFSRPENMFSCKKIVGSYVSSSGQFFETPHLRYQHFPLSGQVQLKTSEIESVKLVHGMEYPGNYYGILFRCETEQALGKNWLLQSPRVSKERGSRQSIEIVSEQDHYAVKIKQVKEVLPGPLLQIPLIDQWTMTQMDTFGESQVSYLLNKLK